MSKTEARQHFGSVHIYWHGPEHCWDAAPTRRRQHRVHDVRQKADQPKWRETISVPPKEEPAMTGVDDTEPSPIAARWVDIVQVVPPSIIRKPEPVATPPPVMREPEPMVAPRGIVIVILVINLALAIVMIFERPISKRNARSRPTGST